MHVIDREFEAVVPKASGEVPVCLWSDWDIYGRRFSCVVDEAGEEMGLAVAASDVGCNADPPAACNVCGVPMPILFQEAIRWPQRLA